MMEKETVGEATGIDGYLFRLIATFEAAAMQQLGKIANPLTGDVEVSLAGASESIEMLAAIQRKTDGNLSADEKRLLEHVLYQLRMNYVDVAREQEQKGGGEAGDEADSGSETGAEIDAGADAETGAKTGAGTDGETDARASEEENA